MLGVPFAMLARCRFRRALAFGRSEDGEVPGGRGQVVVREDLGLLAGGLIGALGPRKVPKRRLRRWLGLPRWYLCRGRSLALAR
jgi:hypothetical protein